MSEFIKIKIQQHSSVYKNYYQKNVKSLGYEILQSKIENFASIISERKSDYYNKLAQKLIDSSFWWHIFSVVNGINVSADQMNKDLEKI